MGGVSSKQGDSIQSINGLRNQLVTGKQQSKQSIVDQRIVSQLQSIQSDLANTKTRNKVITQLKILQHRKQITTCISWRQKNLDQQGNEVQKSAADLVLQVIQADDAHILEQNQQKYYQILFDQQSLLHNINRLAISNNQNFKQSGIKLLSKLSEHQSLLQKLEAINPLYTFNLVASGYNPKKTTRIPALVGIRNLAPIYLDQLLVRGVVTSLINILRESKPGIDNDVIGLAIESLAIGCQDYTVTAKVVEQQIVKNIIGCLSKDKPEVQNPSVKCIQAISNFEIGRNSIDNSTMRQLSRIAQRSSSDPVAISAKMALIALCLSQDKLEYFRSKNLVSKIFSAFSELGSPESRERIVKVIYQISKDCLRYTLYELYSYTYQPLVQLLNNEREIQQIAIQAIQNLVQRPDMQKLLCKTNCVSSLMEIFQQEGRSSQPNVQFLSNCMMSLALLSNNYPLLLRNPDYITFMIAKTSRKQIIQSEQISLKTEDYECIQEIAKLAMITLIAVPQEYIQSNMKKKVKFLCSQCKSNSSYLRIKAVGSISALAGVSNLRKSLLQAGVIQELVSMLKDPQQAVAIQVCQALIAFTIKPDNLELWFKFDSNYVIDSANMHIPEKILDIKPLKKNAGLFNGWGRQFMRGEMIKIKDMPFLQEWSVSV